ncbi:MAG: polyphosphate kinase 1 [Pyrinomonadaceae bacterium]
MSTVIKKEAEIREFPNRRQEASASSPIQLFFNRELSLLEFHKRVLEEALDQENPLLERLKFVSIFASNLDEFFMIRVSGLKEALEQDESALSPDGMTPSTQLSEIRRRLLPLIAEQGRVLTEDIVPALKEAGVEIAPYDSLARHERDALAEYFREKVFPILTPLAVDPSHPFPYISPLSLNLGLMVESPDTESVADGPFLSEPRFVRIKVPSSVPRLIPVGFLGSKYVLLEDVIEANVTSLFPGMIVGTCHRFRVTRDADIEIREEEAQDLLSLIKEELRQRRFGAPVRLEVSCGMPEDMIAYLSASLNLDDNDVYRTDGPLSVQDLMALYDLDRSELKDTPFTPVVPKWIHEYPKVFDAIRAQDRLVHHPYDTYDCVTEFLNEAVNDPDVVAIKMCLYRTGADSPIPPALIRASELGKQVTALIELKARFDEQHNIEWAQKLDEAGVHVVYGVLGLKTHGKLTLIVRREDGNLKRYIHIASGNYNPTTSCTYTDVGLFTVDDGIGRDATEFFNYLTGCSRQMEYRKLVVAPVKLREKLNALLDREIEHKRAGRPARIIAKFNRLADRQIIEKLYEVNNAGVQIDLIVRGICMLRPGIPGLSENISVRSIVGRFLEHSRIFYFENGGREEIFIGSADWMARNLKHRIEVLVPVNCPDSRRYLKDVVLGAYLRDNTKARELLSDGTYGVVQSDGFQRFNSQSFFVGRDDHDNC